MKLELHQLGVERAIVLGHSWGTMVAVSLALQAPTLVRSLVLLSGYYFPTARMDVVLSSPNAIPGIGVPACITLCGEGFVSGRLETGAPAQPAPSLWRTARRDTPSPIFRSVCGVFGSPDGRAQRACHRAGLPQLLIGLLRRPHARCYGHVIEASRAREECVVPGPPCLIG
jgi:pimeloyl-ACP methyl ester carboxylesterase